MKRSFLRLARRSAGTLAAVLLAALAGYRLHDLRLTARAGSATEARWDLDYFVRPSSFSEVEATRAELEGLAYRYRTEVRTRYLATPNPAVPDTGTRAAIIRDLETALSEFRNAPGEAYIAQDLLILLKRSGDYGRWLDLYLDLLYRRPTEDVISLFATEARTLAAATGRQAEVEAALRHVMEIPVEFSAKGHLQTADVHGSALPSHAPGKPTL
ncbi:MAG: hypothetical protein JNL10_22240 [Verrucomicrobiales bacterium]|nr:hypothetical protein [Verrucomicrobiales bacterium]